MLPDIFFSPPVFAALSDGRPVLALESTVIAHGLPAPLNIDTALGMESEAREAGVVPATIGVVAGRPTVGMTLEEIEHFGRESATVRKLSRRDIGPCVAAGGDGATTVGATMALAHLGGVEVFATGGIGGVHRGAHLSWDVSGDLRELSRTPVLVVCAGAKSILDIRATYEHLETLGVPVVGYQCDEFPAFYTPKSGIRLDHTADSPEAVAKMWTAHRKFGGGGGMLVVTPPPEVGIDAQALNAAIDAAFIEAELKGVAGQGVTPYLLSRVTELTEGKSREANIALLKNNAGVGARIAKAIADLAEGLEG
jgi:pseudouridine-5'-phosphate glycosidase